MRSDTTFKSSGKRSGRLVMVDSDVNPDLWDDAAVDSRDSRAAVADVTEDVQRLGTTIAIMVSISAACAATAVATGAYALWLSRHQATRQALTDVDDILRSCQTRMQEMEADLQRQSGREG